MSYPYPFVRNFEELEHLPLRGTIDSIADQLESHGKLGIYRKDATEILSKLKQIYSEQQNKKIDLSLIPYFKLENINKERLMDKTQRGILWKRRNLIIHLNRTINSPLQKQGLSELKEFFDDLSDRVQYI